MVEEMLAAGRTRREMAQVTGMPLRTIDQYTRRVRGRWHEHAVADSQDARGRALDRLFELRTRLVEAGAWSSIVALEKLITTLEGAHESSAPSRPRMSPEAPVITTEWLSERGALLIRAVVSLANKSDDAALRAQLNEALTRGVQTLGNPLALTEGRER